MRLTLYELKGRKLTHVGVVGTPKYFSLIAYLKTSGLNALKGLNANWALLPVSEDEDQMGQTENRPSEKLYKRLTRLIYLLQIAFETNQQ